MKDGIHPKYYTSVKVTCSCGNTFETGSTLESITTELCSKCHPFYTGEEKIVDTANLVSKFETRKKQAAEKVVSKREKAARRKELRSSRHTAKPGSEQTLKDMLKSLSR
jgi:large subunit ribosomal protein L31